MVEFFWENFSDFISDQKFTGKKSSSCVHVFHNTWNWEVSRRSRARTPKQGTKKKRTCKVTVVFLIQTYCFFDVAIVNAIAVIIAQAPYCRTSNHGPSDKIFFVKNWFIWDTFICLERARIEIRSQSTLSKTQTFGTSTIAWFSLAHKLKLKDTRTRRMEYLTQFLIPALLNPMINRIGDETSAILLWYVRMRTG